MFAAGLLLGLAFAVVYFRERTAMSGLTALPPVQKDMGEYATDALQADITLGKDSFWNPRYPSRVLLIESEGNGKREQILKDWVLDPDKNGQRIAFPSLSESAYLLELDLFFCVRHGLQGASCSSQTKYFDFRTKKSSKRTLLELGPIP